MPAIQLIVKLNLQILGKTGLDGLHVGIPWLKVDTRC